MKAPFVFLFPDAVTCASETQTGDTNPASERSFVRKPSYERLILVTMQKKSSDLVDSELISIDRSLNEPVSSFLRLILLLDQTYQIRVLPISCLTGLCRLMGIYVWDENLAAVLAVATFTPPVSGSGDVVH